MSELTHDLILNFKNDQFTVTRADLESILKTPIGETVLLIGIKSRGHAQAIPLHQGKPVLKLIAKMVEDYGSTAVEIDALLKKDGLKYFFSTGFCVEMEDAHCTHESYLTPKEDRPIPDTEIAELNTRIKAIKGIIYAEIAVVWSG